MASVNWDQHLNEIDELVKKGKKSEVLPLIIELVSKNPPLEIKPKIARLANRSGLPHLALKILFRHVREVKLSRGQSLSEAKAVYAQSLLNIGAFQEAEIMLNSITNMPEVSLQKAFVCFAQWDYQAAIPHLRNYLKIKNLPRYQKLVGQVNFIAALVSVGEFKKALNQADQTEKLLIEDKAQLLLGNINELKAQIFIFLKDYQQAMRSIVKSSEYLQTFPGRYSLYTRKWTAVINFHINSDTDQLRLELKKICNEAHQIQDWETIRDCEFHSSYLLNQRKTVDQIYLGSPHAGFRKRLRNLYSLKAPQSLSQRFFIGEFNSTNAMLAFDLSNDQQMHVFTSAELKLLQILLRDLFKPPRIGEVFAGLFPQEYFDPFSSPQRIKNVVHRLNKKFIKLNENIQIKIIKGYFRFESSQPKIILYNHRQLFWKSEKFLLNFLHKIVGNRSFSYSDVQSKFNNLAQFKYLVAWALENGKMTKISQTNPIRYRFLKIS